MDLSHLFYDILIISQSDNYEGTDNHGNLQLFNFFKNNLNKKVAFICLQENYFKDIEDIYDFSNFSELEMEKMVKCLPEHKKVVLGDKNDAGLLLIEKIIEEHNSDFYFLSMVHNFWTGGCSYPAAVGCKKYQFEEGCYNCDHDSNEFNNRVNTRFSAFALNGFHNSEQLLPILMTRAMSIENQFNELKRIVKDKKEKFNIIATNSYTLEQASNSYICKEMNKFMIPFSNVEEVFDDFNELYSNKQELRKQIISNYLQVSPGKGIEKIFFWSSMDIYNSRKGIDLFSDSLHLFKKNNPEQYNKSLFVIVGNPPTNLFLNSVIPYDSNCFCTGKINGSELLTYILGCDFYCCTTLEDAGPRTVVESLAFGTPVISFDRCVSVDVINKQTGHLIELGDVHKYKDALLSSFNLKNKEYKKLSKNSFKAYNQFFNNDIIAEKWTKALYGEKK